MTTAITTWVRRHDPQLVALHRAVRMAIVTPVALAVGAVLFDDPQTGIFASFGCVAFLLFVDFPGTPAARLVANLGLLGAGVVLIVVGTLASEVAWLAVASMAVVGFGVTFAGVVSAAMAAATRAALLAFVLPVTIPGGAAEIGPRLLGWAIAGALAVPAVLWMWPPRHHDAVRAKTATACRELAAWLEALASGDRSAAVARVTTGFAAVDDLRREFRGAEFRPVGMTTGSRLLVRVVGQLDWVKSVLKEMGEDGDPAAWDARTEQVLRRCAAILVAAAVEVDPRVTPPDRPGESLRTALAALDEIRHQEVGLADLRAAHQSGSRPATVHELTYSAGQIGWTMLAVVSADHRKVVDRLLGRNRESATRIPALAAGAVASRRATIGSVWLQNSVRTGAGLGMAVLLAEVTHVSHGFWVALAALSVLRTTAIATGSNAVRALLGTLLGFVAGAVLVVGLGTTPAVLWSLLPVSLLVAGFAPTAISFAAGQAAFTLLVVILFNIIDPVGWTVGAVRIEDVALGSLAGLVCGVLLWPAGAAGQLRRSMAQAYRTGSAALVASTQYVVEGRDRAEAAHDALEQARTSTGLLDDAIRSYLAERGSARLDLDALTATANVSAKVWFAADAVAHEHVLAGIPDELREPTAVIGGSARDSAAWYDRLAGYLNREQGATAPPEPYRPDAAARVLGQVVDRSTEPDAPAGLEAAGKVLWAVALHLDAVTALQRRVLPHARAIAGDHGTPQRAPTPTTQFGD